MRALGVRLGLVLWCLLAPASALGAGWLPAQVALATRDADFLPYYVGSDAQGDVAIAWTNDQSGHVITAERPAGGTFTMPAELTVSGPALLGDVQIDDTGTIHLFFVGDAGNVALSSPRVATKHIGDATWTVTELAPPNADDPPSGFIRGRVLGDGRGLAVWKQFHLVGGMPQLAQSRIEYVRKDAGSAAWSARKDLPGGTGDTADAAIALNAAGHAAVVFTRKLCGNTVDIAFGAVQAPSGVWSTAQQLSACDPGSTRGDTEAPAVGIADDGTVTAAWSHDTAQGGQRQVATHPPGDSPWAGPAYGDDLGAGGSVVLGVQADGTATMSFTGSSAVWHQTRPAGSDTFGQAQQFAQTLTSLSRPSMTPATDGSMLATWMGYSNGSPRVAGAYRPPGATAFGTPLLAPDTSAGYPVVARDDEGNGAVAWMHFDGITKTLTASAYDVGPPRIADVVFPAAATTGVAFGVGATVTDRWSLPTGGWAFGDGTVGATGGSKAYASAGPFTATLTASDAVGNVTSLTRSVTVTDPVPGGGDPADTTAPELSDVSLSRRRFRVDPNGASVSAKAGTTIRYTLSEAATVRFTLERRAAGRRVAGACRKPTARNRKRKRCSRLVAAGGFSASAPAGASELPFAGRVKGRSLRAGRYVITLVATDTAQNASGPVRRSLRIVRREQ